MNQHTAHQLIRSTLADIEAAARRLEGAALLVDGLAPEVGAPPPNGGRLPHLETDTEREWARTRATARGAIEALDALAEADLVQALEAIQALARTPE